MTALAGLTGKLTCGRAVYRVGVILAALLVQGFTSCALPLERYAFEEPHMGTVYKLVLYAQSPESAASASRAAFDRVAELDAMLSDYKPRSELNRLTRAAYMTPIAVSDDLWAVLKRADAVSVQTEGAFDVSVGPIIKLWRRARALRALPKGPRMSKALQQIGYQSIKYRGGQRIELARPNMRLDVGGIAKGYAADAALAVLRERGVASALVDAGGDVSVGNAPPGETGWLVAIRSFDAEGARQRGIRLENASVATSGDAYRFVEIDGVRYSHIVDPSTGIGLTIRRAATVVAPNGALADALASSLCVLGAKRGFSFIREYDGVSALVQEARASGVVEEIAPGFPELLVGPASTERESSSGQGG